MYSWWFLLFALVASFSDAPQQPEELLVPQDGVVLEDEGTAEPLCCGPNEPPPPIGGGNS